MYRRIRLPTYVPEPCTGNVDMPKVKVFLDLGGLLGLQGAVRRPCGARLLRSGLDWSEAMSINDTLETLAGQAGYRTRLGNRRKSIQRARKNFYFYSECF